MENYTKKAFKGTSLAAFFLIGSSFLSYLIRISLAKKLTTEDYGLFFAVMSFMLFLLIFRDMGFKSALTKYIAQFNAEGEISKIKTYIFCSLSFQLISSLILVAVFIGLSKFLAINYFKSEYAIPLLVIFSFYVVISMLTGIFYSILQGFQDVKWYSASETIRLGTTLLTFFPLWFLDFGILAPALAFLGGIVATFIFLMLGTLKYRYLLKFKLGKIKPAMAELVKFSLPVIFRGIGDKVIGYLDVLILTFFLSLSEVGVYNAVLPTALIFMFMAKAISSILFPMSSELWYKNEKKKLARGLELIYNYSLIFFIPVIVIAFIFADVLIGKFFGAEFLAGITAFRILVLGVLCFMITSNNNSVLTGIGKTMKITKITLTAATLNIILNLSLIPKFKLEGAAIATTCSYVLMLIMSTIEIRKLVPIGSPWKNWIKSILAGIIFGGTLYYLRDLIQINYWLNIILALLGGLLVYVMVIYFFDLVDFKEIKKIYQQVRRKDKLEVMEENNLE